MATENKDQEVETASATLADGMHFIGNIEGFCMDLDAEESVGGVGAGPPYKYRFFIPGRGHVPGVFVVCDVPFPCAFSSCSQLKA